MQRKTVHPAFLLPLVFFLVAACAGFPFTGSPQTPGDAGPSFRTPRAVSEIPVSESPAETFNGNQIFAVPGFWDTAPSPEFLFFIGAATIRSNREESVSLALEDAARKVAMYHFLEGRYESHVDVGSGFLEYQAGTVSSLDYDRDYLKYTGDLVYDPERDILQWENSLFVRARYPLNNGEVLPPARVLAAAGDRPGWINTPPEDISGYVYGVGLAGRRAYHRDTVNGSCEAAVFAIIRNISGRAAGGAADVQKSGALGYSGASGASVSSALSLKGFYVLDTWIDPVSKAVWTLALAREDLAGEGGAGRGIIEEEVDE
jgi:hypothetical protein